METKQTNLIIAKNIADYRKRMKWTQLELAEHIHYSDKSVSKWERGEAIPDIDTLKLLAETFGITVNELVYFQEKQTISEPGINRAEKFTRKHFYITLIAVSAVLLSYGFSLLLLGTLAPTFFQTWWLPLLFYSLSLAFLVWFIFVLLWWPSLWQQICCSGLLWTLAVGLFLTLSSTKGIWMIFLFAGGIQMMLILWYFLKKSSRRGVTKMEFFPKK